MRSVIVYYSYSGNTRTVAGCLCEYLKQRGQADILELKALDEAQLKSLASFGPTKQLKNHRGLVTGKSYPVFNLFE